MTHALTTPDDLATAGLSTEDPVLLSRVAQEFRIRITPEMQMRDQAITAQFVPSGAELTTLPEELTDPIGDDAHSPVKGLTHRYPDRVILHITKTCDVYCRFCFRRETVGETGPLPAPDLDAALEYIAATQAIREVVLTGGDPLTLSPRRLRDVLSRLDVLPHLAMVRFHTRVPVVAPERITPELTQLIADLRLAPWMVLHTNHAAELTPNARAALARLVDAGIPVISQSVLLRGVNDSAEALAELFTTLSALRVKPYYLHHCDLARGTSHFRTTIDEGRALMRALRGRISGHCLPTYVLDIPGGHGKVPISAEYFAQQSTGHWKVTDWQGRIHDYLDPKR
ncbi:lysine-2,3-aminomutase-like protein [Thioclava litoralis]|uniref:Lysine-2,3-aminomutase-like protein n=1 Tax=Thioclava litoralis TaxID=3076557 RepID=A0ABZ1E2W7_9RHOB|nr:lysine-2,3-aminomutase-like protein [Thioclava sp. FTW29]